MPKLLMHSSLHRLFALALPLAVFVVLIVALPVHGQLSDDDIAALRQQAQNEDWTFEVGHNSATQYSLDELCGLVEPPDWREKANFDPCTPKRNLPSTFDWREVTGCPPVRNQGGCGSCWAFATVGALECAIVIMDGDTVNLSEQWLVSCNTNGWDCGGGWFAHSYHENRTDPCGDYGAVLESDFPYYAQNLPCNCPYPHHQTIDSWSYIEGNSGVASTAAMKQAIMEYGPISVAVYANSAMQAYNGGVFNGCGSGTINHAVVLVGWDDTQDDAGIWIMRNSWGGGWGEGGYMRMPYGCSSIGYAACYIDYRPVYVSPYDTLGPVPLTVDFQMEVPGTTLDSCYWNFGDGDTSTEQNPSHEYLLPGYHTVTLDIYTADGQFTKTYPGMISGYADTLSIEDVQAEPGSTIKVDVLARNYLPLKEIMIPYNWAGPLNLVFDSFSTAGLRTEYFDDQRVINYDPFNKRMTLYFDASDTGTKPYLSAGDEPIVSLYFTVPGSATKGTNPIELTGYAGFEPNFLSYAGDYEPVNIDGAVRVNGCCLANVGNVDCGEDDAVDVSDLTELIDHLFVSYTALCCADEANTSGDPEGMVDIADLTELINHLFINFTQLPECQ